MIGYLADHRDVIPQLAEWFHREWSHLYGDKTVRDVRMALEERINRDAIPLALLAFEGDRVVATVSLKVHDMDTRLDLSPWLAGLYVDERFRNRGMGTAMVRAIEHKAQELGTGRLYLYTPTAESFYLRMAWRTREKTDYHGSTVAIMEKEMSL